MLLRTASTPVNLIYYGNSLFIKQDIATNANILMIILNQKQLQHLVPSWPI